MRLYTVLTSRDPAALQAFAATALLFKATGVTVFTRPDLVAPTPPPGAPTAQSLQDQADQAAARKDYTTAAKFQAQIEQLRLQNEALNAQAAQWVKDALTPIHEITQLVVLGNIHWPTDKPFTQENFLTHLPQISTTLLTTGIGGIVQKTPLAERTFVPLVAVQTQAATPVATPVAGGQGAQGDPATPAQTRVGVGAPTRHPSIPAVVTDKKALFATYRLGLDRGGARRSRQEAGNLMGWSPGIANKIESEISKVWPEFEAKINENTPELATA
jgi:hypothetical protein